MPPDGATGTTRRSDASTTAPSPQWVPRPEPQSIEMREKPLQLLADARPGMPALPRAGRARGLRVRPLRPFSIFVWAEPLPRVALSLRRFNPDWPGLGPRRPPSPHRGVLNGEEKIILVMDNLNTHSIASPTRPSHSAYALASRLKIHHAPKGRLLAQRRRDRAVLADQAMLGPAHRRPRRPQRRAHRLDRHPRRPAASRVEVHHQRRPHQVSHLYPALRGETPLVQLDDDVP